VTGNGSVLSQFQAELVSVRSRGCAGYSRHAAAPQLLRCWAARQSQALCLVCAAFLLLYMLGSMVVQSNNVTPSS